MICNSIPFVYIRMYMYILWIDCTYIATTSQNNNGLLYMYVCVYIHVHTVSYFVQLVNNNW